jgi:hypothetical protein
MQADKSCTVLLEADATTHILVSMYDFIRQNQDHMPEFDAIYENGILEHRGTSIIFSLTTSGCVKLKLIVNTQKQQIGLFLKALKLRGSQPCSYTGKEYMLSLRYLIETFFSRYNGVFAVSLDAAVRTVMQNLQISRTELMITESCALASGYNSTTLEEFCMLQGIVLNEIPELQSFWFNVIQHEYPTIYTGSISVQEFAACVIAFLVAPGNHHFLARSHVGTLSRTYETNNRQPVGTQQRVSNLLVRMWFSYIVPHIDSLMSAILVIDGMAEPPKTPFPMYITLVGQGIQLASFVALTSDTPQTWYMKILGLKVCEQQGRDLVSPNDQYKTEFVNEILMLKARTLRELYISPNFSIPNFPQNYFDVILDRTVGELAHSIMTSARNQQTTYYDTIVSELIEAISEKAIMYVIDNPCRLL